MILVKAFDAMALLLPITFNWLGCLFVKETNYNAYLSLLMGFFKNAEYFKG